MNTNVKSTNIELTDAIKNHLNKRLRKIEKFVSKNDTSAMMDVEVGTITKGQHSGEIFRAEINLHIAGEQLRSVSEKENLYKAIDDTQKEIIRSVKRTKKKDRKLFKKGSQKIKSMFRR